MLQLVFFLLKVSEAAMRPCDLTVRWLQRVERVAQGFSL